MKAVIFLVLMLVPVALFAASVDNRCPKGYVWSDSQKRCVTAPPEVKEGACTKSSKPWMLNCSTSKKLLSIDSIYQSGYYIDRYMNGFFFLKKRSASDQECSTPKTKPAPAPAPTPAETPAK